MVAGTWTHPLPNGEQQRLMLFDSGVMGYQHVGSELPISLAYGRWSSVDGKLAFDIVGIEPEVAPPTLPDRLATLRAQWQRVADPYGTTPGARDREATDERNWTYRVSRTNVENTSTPNGH